MRKDTYKHNNVGGFSKMNKTELVAAIAEKAGISKKDADAVL